jgi:hypothetical protein
MTKKIKEEVEFDFEEFFKSIHEYKEHIRQRYADSIKK